MDEHKPRRMPWFRFYDEALTDPKMAQLSNAEWGYWTKLLCFANQQNPRGEIYYGEKNFSTFSEKVLNISRKSSGKFLEKFEDLGLIHFDEDNECLVITNWHKRQFPSDDVTARTLKYHQRKRLRQRSIERPRVDKSRVYKESTEQNNVSGRDNDTNDAFNEINNQIDELAKELEKSKQFPKVFPFISKMRKQKKHPGSILLSLVRCHTHKPGSPWAYCQEIVGVESGNFYEADNQKEATAMKEGFSKVFGNGQGRRHLD